MDSKIHESNTIGKKYKEQIDNLLQNDNDLKLQIDNLKEENTVLKTSSKRFGMKIKIYLFKLPFIF